MDKKKYAILYKNKYLDDLGIPENEYGVNFLDKDDSRLVQYEQERKIYGFDSRETWNLDSMFAEWLYTRCKMYLEQASGKINLEYHKFQYDGKEYTQRQMIDMIIENCEFFIKNRYGEEEAKAYEKMKEAAKMWAEVFPAMWW